MSFLWLMPEWKNGEFKKKGHYLLFHFLTQKMKINNLNDLNSIINNKGSIKTTLKKILKLFETTKRGSPNAKLILSKAQSDWIVRENDVEYIGWTVFNANFLVDFINNNNTIPNLLKVNTFKYSTLKDIGASLFFNIFNQFIRFKYLNIGDINTDLVNGISQLLSLESLQVYNYKSSNLVNVKTRNNKFSLITIFMGASHFKNIESMFAFIYEICADGGYLLIREYDLPQYQRDKAFLYETFYNLYKILFKEIDIDDFVKNMKPLSETSDLVKNKYKTRDEWIQFISSFGFIPVALNIPYEVNHYYDYVYILFKKI